jgi:hypothetical protein
LYTLARSPWGRSKRLNKEIIMTRTLLAGALGVSLLLGGAGAADARGCIKGAVVGGVAGHFAGHHALAGAAAGCVIGHHMANRHAHRR